MVNTPKHCWTMSGSTFDKFIGHSEGNSVGKNLSWWYAKYSDCLLSHWLPMTIILFVKETIDCNICRYNYLRKKKKFSIFFFLFFFFFWIFKIYIQFWTFSVPIWDNPSTSNMVNGLKLGWNLNYSTFTIYIDHCEGNSVAKSLSWGYAKS